MSPRGRKRLASSRSRTRNPSTAAQAPPAGHRHGGSFTGTLWRYPGPGGWHFVQVPDELAPPVTHGWGRTPVHAEVDGQAWKTSVWRGKDGRTLLAVPRAVRGGKGAGDSVRVRIGFDAL